MDNSKSSIDDIRHSGPLCKYAIGENVLWQSRSQIDDQEQVLATDPSLGFGIRTDPMEI